MVAPVAAARMSAAPGAAPAGGAEAAARRAWLLAVFCVALAVRALFLFELFPHASRIVPGLSTSVGMSFDGYEMIARQLVQGHGYRLAAGGPPTAARAPLYPLLLAGLYRVFGAGAVAPVLWVHALLGALACAFVTLAGCRMFGRAAGTVAGLLFAFFPPHLWWSQYVLSDTLLVTLIAATFFAVVRLVQEPSAGAAAAAGALFGLTALCNAMILFLPFVLVAVAAAVPGLRRRYVRHAGVLLLAMGVMVLPWTGRNFLLFRRVIPVNWSVGLQYMKGLIIADDFTSGRARDLGALDDSSMVEVLRILRENGRQPGDFDERLRVFRSSQTVPLADDDLLKRLAVERVRANPGLAVRKVFLNLWLYWFLSNRMMLANQVVNFSLLGLALLGLALGAWRMLEARVLVLFCLYFWLGYSAVIVSARFALQIAPLLAVLAGYAIVALARRAFRRGGAQGVMAAV
jgi:4-amino-4-deoxy-L-arabinose transferase-like glycosyltransferase